MDTAEHQQTDVSEGASVTHLFTSDQPNIKVRDARPEDAPWIAGELKEFAKFYGTRKLLFPDCESVAAKIIAKMIENHLFIVAESPTGVPFGFMAGWVTPHIFNPVITMLSEAFWWVKPEYRGTRAGALLFKAFVNWGREHADWVTMTLEPNSPVKPETLIKRGFSLQERVFLFETERT